MTSIDHGQTCHRCGVHFKYQWLHDEHEPCLVAAAPPPDPVWEGLPADVYRELDRGLALARQKLVGATYPLPDGREDLVRIRAGMARMRELIDRALDPYEVPFG